MKILVIEDDVKIADYIAKGLRESGYVVDTASDGHDGADLALNGIAWLLTDMRDPGEDAS